MIFLNSLMLQCIRNNDYFSAEQKDIIDHRQNTTKPPVNYITVVWRDDGLNVLQYTSKRTVFSSLYSR